MSLNMLIETPGGFDFTGADCPGWMQEAGFRESYVEHLLGPDSMVVGSGSSRTSRQFEAARELTARYCAGDVTGAQDEL